MKRSFYSFLVVLLLSTPLTAQPTQVFTGIAFPYDLLFKGNELYVSEAGGPGGIYLGDITASEPSSLMPVALFSTPRRMVFAGDILYVPQSFEGNLFKIDVTAPNPVPELVLSGLSNPTGMALRGNELYFSEADAGTISKIDITDPNPTPMVVLSGLGYVQTIAFNGDDLYFCNGNISRFDITASEPEIVLVVETEAGSLELDITFYEDYLYYAESFGGTIQKLDLGDPSATPETIAQLINALSGLTIRDDILYYSTDEGAGTGSIYRMGVDDNLAVNDTEAFGAAIRVYPNPANDQIQLSGLSNGMRYTIYNAAGSFVKSGAVNSHMSISIPELASGLYVLAFENGQRVKFVKE